MKHGFLAPADILPNLPLATGMTVGECGVSASGDMMKALSEVVGPDGRVLAFDVNKNVLSAMASQARLHHLQNVSAIWTDLEVVGGTKQIADHQLDAALAVHLLNESKNHAELLTELRRMLKPGAHLLIIDWTKESTHPLAPSASRRLSSGYLVQRAAEFGFSTQQPITPDNDHWGVLLTAT